MEKISHIVGGSARVGATDNMNAPAVRPGVPSYGRPIGLSPQAEHSDLSTAQRAGALQSDMLEQKKMRSEGKAATDISTQFFNRSEEPGKEKEGVREAQHDPVIRATSSQRESLGASEESEQHPTPSKFTPRGSYIDMRA